MILLTYFCCYSTTDISLLLPVDIPHLVSLICILLGWGVEGLYSFERWQPKSKVAYNNFNNMKKIYKMHLKINIPENILMIIVIISLYILKEFILFAMSYNITLKIQFYTFHSYKTMLNNNRKFYVLIATKHNDYILIPAKQWYIWETLKYNRKFYVLIPINIITKLFFLQNNDTFDKW